MPVANAYLAVDPVHLLQVVLALVCGAVLGVERETRNHPAGVRTIMLITVGACVCMIVGRFIAADMAWPEEHTRIDPGRMPSYVIAGIGFLGAGPILAWRGRVHGLTTAAAIWVAAAIGLLIGIDRFALAVSITLMVTAVLHAMAPLSRWVNRSGTWYRMPLRCDGDEIDAQVLLSVLRQHAVEVDEIVRDDSHLELQVRFRSNKREDALLFRELRDLPGVGIRRPVALSGARRPR